MKVNKLILVLTLVFMFAVFGTLLFYYTFVLENIQDYEMELKVTEKGHAAFNVAADKVYFSKVPLGGTGQRTLQIFGNRDRDVFVKFKASGKLSEWITIEDNFFVLPKNTAMNLTIYAHVPEDATPGEIITGKLRGTFLRYW